MNIEYKGIKAILFDSGHTLNRPQTNHWFIPPRFEELIDNSRLDRSSLSFRQAMEKAYNHLMQNHHVRSEEEEYEQFREFFSILLEECRYGGMRSGIIDLLAWDTVYNDERLIFFDDVANALEKLSNRFLLGIVSDAWPSLERIYENKGIRKYFSTFVISSVHGVCKSDKKLLGIALEELKIRPSEAVFVDDNTGNLLVAKELGIIPIKMDRYRENPSQSKFMTISSLEELYTIMTGC